MVKTKDTQIIFIYYRKSVIVKRKSVIQPRIEKHSKSEDETAKEEISLVLSLNIHDLESMYTLEEKSYIGNLVNLFDDKWNSLSLDEQTMNQSRSFWQNGITENVSMEYFKTINFYLR